MVLESEYRKKGKFGAIIYSFVKHKTGKQLFKWFDVEKNLFLPISPPTTKHSLMWRFI